MHKPISLLLLFTLFAFVGCATAPSLAVNNNLGTQENPIKADMPQGQRAYLNRLRCKDNTTPSYYRIGNVGIGAFGHIVDLYQLNCANSEPKESKLYMDMYFPGHVENNAPNGFTIVD